jgi:hypothetical protein
MAWTGELRGILPQARHDPIDVGHLGAAQPEDIGRAGHLLLERSPVFIGESGSRNHDAKSDRHSNAQENSVRSHVRSFFSDSGGVLIPSDNLSRSGFKPNEAR